MPIEFACEACGKLLRVPDGSGGLSCECPACRTLLEIPDPAAINFVQSAQGQDVRGQLRVACPKCSAELACAEALLGTKGQCKNCKYIFTISTDKSAAAEQEAGWFFECPECQQLFAGAKEMNGRRGKCHSCGKVFMIDLRRSSDAKINFAGPTDAGYPQPANLAGDLGFAGQSMGLGLQIDPTDPGDPKPPIDLEYPNATLSPQSSTHPQPSTHPQSTRHSGTPSLQGPSKSPNFTSGKASSSGSAELPLGNIRMVCSSCQGVMEVPGSTAGLTTACPYCQQLLAIPTPSSPPPGTGTALPAAGTGTAAGGPTGTHPSFTGMGAAGGTPVTDHVPPGTGAAKPLLFSNQEWGMHPQSNGPLNPYAAPVPDFPDFGGEATVASVPGGYGSDRRNRRDPIVYVLPGIFIALFGVLQILGVAINILTSLGGVSGQRGLNANLLEVQGAIAFLVILGLAVSALSIVQIIGGVCMARRKGLLLARVAAVIACLPCITCAFLNIPFGIWGLVVCLTGSVKRDFRH